MLVAAFVAADPSVADERPGSDASTLSDGPAAERSIAVRWTEIFPIRRIEDAGRLLDDKEFVFGGVSHPARLTRGGMGLADPDSVEGREQIETCRVFFKETEKSFDLQTSYDIAAFSFFEARCIPLRFLTEARPSATSVVKEYLFSRKSLADLPACLGRSISDSSKFSPTGSLAGMKRGWRVKKATARSLEFENSESRRMLDLLAWGDVNGDGIEDVVTTVSEYQKGGSFRSFSTLVLTRLQPKSLFLPIAGDHSCIPR